MALLVVLRLFVLIGIRSAANIIVSRISYSENVLNIIRLRLKKKSEKREKTNRDELFIIRLHIYIQHRKITVIANRSRMQVNEQNKRIVQNVREKNKTK